MPPDLQLTAPFNAIVSIDSLVPKKAAVAVDTTDAAGAAAHGHRHGDFSSSEAARHSCEAAEGLAAEEPLFDADDGGAATSHQRAAAPSEPQPSSTSASASVPLSASAAAAGPDEQQPPPPPTAAADSGGRITLNAEQLKIIELATKGYNLYIGGSAGTGKTQLLKALRHVLQHRLGLTVGVVATTGVAGRNLGGYTLHSYFGMTRDDTLHDRTDLLRNDVVIVDEVSLLPISTLASLDENMRIRAGHSPLPFAGVQMILCGDFLQLPVVQGASLLDSELFFNNFVMCGLKTVVRQTSGHFVDQLREWRSGRIPDGFLEARSVTGTDFYAEAEDVPDEGPLTKLVDDAPQNSSSSSSKREEGGGGPLCKADAIDSKESAAAPPQQALAALPSLPTGGAPASCAVPAAAPPPLSSCGEPPALPTESDWKEQPWNFVKPDTTFLTPTLHRTRYINDYHMRQLGGHAYQLRTIYEPPRLYLPQLWSDHYILSVGARFRVEVFRLWVFEFLNNRMEGLQFGDLYVYKLKDRTYAMRCRIPRFCVDEAEAKEKLVQLLNQLPTALAAYIHDNPTWREAIERQENLLNYGVTKRLAVESGLLKADTTAIGVPEDYEPKAEDHRLYCQFVGTGPADGPYCPYREEMGLMKDLAHSYPVSTFKVGARVMLDTNVSNTLINGLAGTILAMIPLTTEVIALAPKHTRPHIVRFIEAHLAETGGLLPYVPIVDFGPLDPRTIVFPESMDIISRRGRWMLPILRIPLKPAYAFTIHKIQGLTLTGNVHVDLFDSWPCDHLLYVAFSRVRNAEQLTISGFRPGYLRVNAPAALFDQSLPAPAEAELYIPPTAFPALWKRFPDLRNARRARLLTQKREAKRAQLMEKILSLKEEMRGQGAGSASGAPRTPFVPYNGDVAAPRASGKRPMSRGVLAAHHEAEVARAEDVLRSTAPEEADLLSPSAAAAAGGGSFIDGAAEGGPTSSMLDLAEGIALRAAIDGEARSERERRTRRPRGVGGAAKARHEKGVSPAVSALDRFALSPSDAFDDAFAAEDSATTAAATAGDNGNRSAASFSAQRDLPSPKRPASFAEKLRAAAVGDAVFASLSSSSAIGGGVGGASKRFDVQSLFKRDAPIVPTSPPPPTAAILSGFSSGGFATKSTSAFSPLPLPPSAGAAPLFAPEEEEALMSPHSLLDAEGDALYSGDSGGQTKAATAVSRAAAAATATASAASPTEALLRRSSLAGGGVGAGEGLASPVDDVGEGDDEDADDSFLDGGLFSSDGR